MVARTMADKADDENAMRLTPIMFDKSIPMLAVTL
jgi:hypothetical protein